MSTTKNNSLILMVQAALFAALITVFTWLVHIPFPLQNDGYVHIGDAVIYLAAATLPLPYAMAAAGIGGGLADVLVGAPMWVIATVPIKALLCLCFSSRGPKLLTLRNGIGSVGAAIVNGGGYYVAECLLFGELAGLASVWGGLIQGGASVALFFILAPALDGLKWKERVKGLS